VVGQNIVEWATKGVKCEILLQKLEIFFYFFAIWNHGNHGTLFFFNTHECKETQIKNPFDPIFMPWVEDIMCQDGLINLMKCSICSLIERKENLWAINEIHWPNIKAIELPSGVRLIERSREGKNTLQKTMHTWKITNYICKKVQS
jgi:hypothetical protein